MTQGNRICILVPTYNNERTLARVLGEVLEIWPDVIVVNDGSTDGTSGILDGFPEIRRIDYEGNQGKGYALRQGFAHALQLGYDYAITLDSDGQHDPADLRKMIAEVKTVGKDTLLMGSRNMDQSTVPRKSSFGNKFSNFWVWFNTGEQLSDTQTGFRAYPLRALADHRWYSKKFEFEVEVLVRLSWAGVDLREVPVSVDYPEDRVSHFRPMRDFGRISVLNTVFFVLTLAYYAPKRLFFSSGEKNIFNRVRREFFRHQDDPLQMAGSVGLGLFFGIFPIWGFQMAVAFLVASILKLNRVVVLAFSNISIPPMIPFIILGSYFFGSFFVEEKVLIPDFSQISLETIYLQLQQYLIGSVLLSIFVGGLGFLATFCGMWFLKK